ncbi:MAG TPA: hypothetical protein VF066_04655 [Thermoleophilaceae bacterium]
MGLFRKREPGIRAQGRLLGIGATARGARQTGARDVEMQLSLAVTMPDGDAFEADFVGKVPHAKSPLVGDTLPIEVDADEREITRVLFDEMPDLADRARASAAAAQAGDSAGAAAALGFKLKE